MHRLQSTITALAVFLAIVISSTVVGSEIDLTKLMPGNTSAARPQLVVTDGKLVNQGAAPALNLEVTRPRYRLIGDLAAGEAIEIPVQATTNEFTIQYELHDDGKQKRETKSFRTGAATQGGAAPTKQTTVAGVDGRANIYAASNHASPNETSVVPSGLTASYDPATHLLTVSAAKPIEVRVDGFLLRPVSRTDETGGEYRYAQANLLVLGQDLQQGETTTFEVVFTKPQDFYPIPIYVREPGKPPIYLTVSVSIGATS